MYILGRFSTNLQWDAMQTTVCSSSMYGGRVRKRHYGLKTLNIWDALSFTLEMWPWLTTTTQQ